MKFFFNAQFPLRLGQRLRSPESLMPRSRPLDRWVILTLALVLTLITLLFAMAERPTVAQGSRSDRPSEIRGVWITNVDSEVLFDRTRLSRMVQSLERLNFNTLYPAVWNWGYTLYPSPVAKQAIGAAVDPRPIGLSDRDMLAELVQQGHQQGMAVIPWFEFGFMAPADSALAIRHPDWLTQQADGTQTWQEGIYPRVWLNPFNPEVQQFILNLLVELVTLYDIDGIQLDDHFGLPYQFGYDKFTIALYRSENGGKLPPKDPKDPTWIRWRADKITQFTQRLFRAIKAKKEVLISLSPNKYDFSYKHSLQDWSRWEKSGLIEELILQNYVTAYFSDELKQPEVQAARRHIPTGVGVFTGRADKLVPMSQIQEQVQWAREKGFPGISFFFYESLWNIRPSGEKIENRKDGFHKLFPTWVDRPVVGGQWKAPQ